MTRRCRTLYQQTMDFGGSARTPFGLLNAGNIDGPTTVCGGRRCTPPLMLNDGADASRRAIGQEDIPMSEFQKCQKCGRTFAQLDRSGSSIGEMGDIMRRADDKMCPICGGRVIWVDDSGSPMSAYKRMEDANRHLRLGCLWGLVALIGWLLFYYFVLR